MGPLVVVGLAVGLTYPHVANAPAPGGQTYSTNPVAPYAAIGAVAAGPSGLALLKQGAVALGGVLSEVGTLGVVGAMYANAPAINSAGIVIAEVAGVDNAPPTTLALRRGLVGAAGSVDASASTAVASVDGLSAAAGKTVSGDLTAAGRALQKHGARGGAFPEARGTPAQISETAQGIVDDILTSPGSTTTTRSHTRFGDITDVVAPDGRGVRYDADGNFIGLLEPPR